MKAVNGGGLNWPVMIVFAPVLILAGALLVGVALHGRRAAQA